MKPLKISPKKRPPLKHRSPGAGKKKRPPRTQRAEREQIKKPHAIQATDIFASMQEGVATFDISYDAQGRPCDYTLRTANASFRQLFDLRHNNLAGKRSNYFLHKGIHPHRETYFKVAETLQAVNFVDHYPALHKYLLTSVFSPQKGFFIILLKDITEIKLMETILFNQEERLRLALEAANQGFWEWQAQVHAVQVSPGYFSMIGSLPARNNTVSLEDLEKNLHPADKDAAFTVFLKHARQKSDTFETEIRVKNDIGLWLWLLVRGRIIARDKGKNPLRITGTYVNITESKQRDLIHRFQRDFAIHADSFADLEEVLRQCFEDVLSLSGIDCGGIYLFDEQEGLQLIAHRGFSPEFLHSVSYFHPSMRQITLVQKGLPVHTHYSLLPFDKDTARLQEGLKAISIIPISHRGKVFGCFNLASHALDEFPAYLQQALESFASFTGNVLLRLQTQMQLAQSEERYRSIFDQSPIGIALFSAQGSLLHVNQAYYTLFGIPSPLFLANYNLLENPFWDEETTSDLLKGKSLHMTRTFDFQFAGAFGILQTSKTERLFLDMQMVALGASAQKKPAGFLMQILDITEQNLHEEALRLSESRMELALWGAETGFWDINLATGALFTNPRWLEMIGYGPGEFDLTFSRWQTAVHPDDLPRFVAALNQHYEGQTPFFEIEYRLQTISGQWKWFVDRGKVVERDVLGRPARMTGTRLDITEKKQFEKDFHFEQNKAQTFLDVASVMILAIDVHQKVLFINRKGCEILGYPESEVVQQNWFDHFLPPAIVQPTKAVFDQLIQGHTKITEYHENEILRRDGQARLIAWHNTLLKDADNNIYAALSSGEDITERRRAEEELRQSKERMDLALKGAELGLWDCDLANNRITTDDGFARMLGYTPDTFQVIDFNEWQSLIHPDDLAGLQEKWRLHLQNDTQLLEIEFRMRNKSGDWKWFLSRGKIMKRDAQGQPLRIVGTHRDITPRLQSEAALQEAKNRLEAVIENTPQIAIQGFNRQGVICHWNKACEAFYGFQREEVFGQHFHHALFSNKLGNDFGKVLEHIWQSQKPVEPVEWECNTRNGQRKWFYSSIFPIFEKERVSEVFCMDLDITSRKLAEEKLLLAKEKAEETNLKLEKAIATAHDLARQASIADAAKSQFLANVSHEIRTPMNSIVGFAEMLLDGELSIEQRNAVETILGSTETLMTLINDILDLSKVEAGQIELEKIPVNLENIVIEVCELLRSKIGKKNIEVLCDFNAPLQVLGDPTRLRQILLNLLGNAFKFTQTGEIITSLTLVQEKDNLCQINFNIQDTGIGIPQNKILKIFEPFTQANGSTSRIYGGTGLGLTISQKLVSLMGGTISLETRQNSGSTFSFTLWFEKRALGQESADYSAIEKSLTGSRLLLIDDNASFQRIMGKTAAALEMHCQAASSFASGIQLLSESSWDAVLVDVHLPDLDLPSLRQKAVSHRQDAPAQIIAIAASPALDKFHPDDALFDGMLAKPFRRASFVQLLNTLLHPQKSNEVGRKQYSLLSTKPISARILLAEDNKSSQEIMIKILERMGHIVDVATDGLEVLSLLEKYHYDLIFMDMQMPNMGGLETAYTLRQRGQTLPIVALTANAMKGDREKCLTAGMNDYISKPVNREAILDILQRYVGIRLLTEMPETMRILLAGENKQYCKTVYEAFHQAFPMASCRLTSDGSEAGVLLGSFLPDLLVIDLHIPNINALALIQLIKSDHRYAHTRIIVYNAQDIDKMQLHALRHLGLAVILPAKVHPQHMILTTKQLLSDAQSFHLSECDENITLVESISQELGISSKDYYDILDIFFKNNPVKIRQLKTALDDKNTLQAGNLAHSIKSSALALRLQTVANPASRLEKLMVDNEWTDIDMHFKNLQNAFEAVHSALRRPQPEAPSPSAETSADAAPQE
ncbi:PAS domain S-box protein [candidate division FCPU426 bacterium]|nr:PAS domain S-box protein [candidate division FCPU426 bacterium]